MALRDYFAGQALASLMALDMTSELVRTDLDVQMAQFCYRLADAMLKEREKINGSNRAEHEMRRPPST